MQLENTTVLATGAALLIAAIVFHRALHYYFIKWVQFISLLVLSTFVVIEAHTVGGYLDDINTRGGYLFGKTASLIGLTYVIENEELLKDVHPCVFIVNHQSSLDVLTMSQVFPRKTKVIMKESIKFIPMIGHFFTLGKNIFIRRTDRVAAMKSLDLASNEVLAKGESIWIYPEGTRSHAKAPALLPFKKGAFHLAINNKVPLVPIVFSLYEPSIYDSRKRIYHGGVIRIRVLPKIETKDLTTEDTNALMEKSQVLMLEALKQISVPSPVSKESVSAESSAKPTGSNSSDSSSASSASSSSSSSSQPSTSASSKPQPASAKKSRKET